MILLSYINFFSTSHSLNYESEFSVQLSYIKFFFWEWRTQGMILSILLRDVDLYSLGCLIDDCKPLLHDNALVCVEHLFQETNSVADRLAHYALSSSEGALESERMESPLVWLLDTLIQDSLRSCGLVVFLACVVLFLTSRFCPLGFFPGRF